MGTLAQEKCYSWGPWEKIGRKNYTIGQFFQLTLLQNKWYLGSHFKLTQPWVNSNWVNELWLYNLEFTVCEYPTASIQLLYYHDVEVNTIASKKPDLAIISFHQVISAPTDPSLNIWVPSKCQALGHTLSCPGWIYLTLAGTTDQRTIPDKHRSHSPHVQVVFRHLFCALKANSTKS